MNLGPLGAIRAAWRWHMVEHWADQEKAAFNALMPDEFAELKSFARTLAQIRAIPTYTRPL